LGGRRALFGAVCPGFFLAGQRPHRQVAHPRRGRPRRDVTKATNGQEFNLEVTSEGKLNYLTKYLHVSTGEGDKPDEMKMTLYNSRKDMKDGENSQGAATWYRDE